MTYKPFSIPTTLTADLPVSSKEALVQIKASNNFVPSNFREFTDGSSGSTGASNFEFFVSTGTSMGGYGTFQSFRSVIARSGAGIRFEGSARFTTGVANSEQGFGLFTIGDGLLIGYRGDTFSVFRYYGGVAEVQRLTITTPASGSTDATVTINGTAYTIPLTSGTVEHNAYEIEDYLTTNATGWHFAQNGDTVVMTALSDGDKSDTFSFSHASAAASFTEVTTGVSKTYDEVAQADFNGVGGSTVFTGFDPTRGNKYRIEYDGGYGNVIFSIKNPSTEEYQVMHTIEYTNSAGTTRPLLNNPSMKVGLYAFNSTNTSNLTMYTTDLSAYLMGKSDRVRNPRTQDAEKSVSTTLTNILTLRNRREFNGYINQGEILLLSLSASTESNKGATISIYGNATVAGEPNFTYVNENSLISEYDTSGTTVTGGRPLFSFTIGSGEGSVIDLTPYKIVIPATLRCVVAAKVNGGGASANVKVSLNWYEDV